MVREFLVSQFPAAEAAYIWTGLGEHGFSSVRVNGHVQNFITGIALKCDHEFVGGLEVRS